MFKQTPQQFFTSKTNLSGIGMLVFGIAGFLSGALPMQDAVQAVLAGAATLGLRDALAK